MIINKLHLKTSNNSDNSQFNKTLGRNTNYYTLLSYELQIFQLLIRITN